MERAVREGNPLGTERVEKLMIRYAIPSIISIVVNSLYNMVDQIFIGQGVGYLGNAATNVILPLSTLLIALGLLIGDGAASYMSLCLGMGDSKTAAHGVGNAVTLTIGTGIVMAVLFGAFLPEFCGLFGATESSMSYALDYGYIIVLGFPFAIIDSALGSIIRADGQPKASMAGLLIGCVTNIICDPLFIFVFHWGVRGAALATILGQALNAVYFILCLFRFKSIKLKKSYFTLETEIIRKFLPLGLSSFFTQVAAVLVIAVMNNVLVSYGAQSKYGADIPLAALGITMKVSNLITGVSLGIATGIQPILGYNYGSRQYDRVKYTYKLALLSATVILAIAFVIFQVFPEQIISIFGQESDLYMEFAVKCFRIYLCGCFMIGAGGVTGILFQAIGKPVPAALLSLSRQIIFLIPALLIFSYLFGVEGALWAGPFSDILSGVISLIVVVACWNKIFAGGKEDAYSSSKTAHSFG
ncbi:MAG: MATE family efflux transporter [Clostridiales bacterium]|nr:MATE family efflux transporter [Clostridiales bacterium]